MSALSQSLIAALAPSAGLFGLKPVLIDRARVAAALARVELREAPAEELYAALTDRFAIDLDVLAGLLSGQGSDTFV
ncbi:MAG TPA: hypothetical protein VIL65_09990 [Beijerinckiaceae bacterium]|jgi:hypothetical protein